MSVMPLLRLTNLTKSFGSVTAVHPLNLDIDAGDFCAILGPSGCGKSTLLRMIAGFVEPTAGSVTLDGVNVTALGPEKRPTNMVFQGYGLFPHLTVAQNVAFGLRLRRLPEAEIERHVAEALALVRLDGFGSRTIDQLSGGQQQRVALARALVMQPKVLLLDEPLAALDLKLRHAMQGELRRIHRQIGGTFIFVTHDQGEAFALANRVAVMNAGRVEQIGRSDEIYLNPRSLFVADFVGEATMLHGRREGDVVELAAGPVTRCPGREGEVRAMIRPSRITIDPPPGHLAVDARILEAVFLGDAVRIVAAHQSGETLIVRDHDLSRRERYIVGAVCRFGWAQEDQRIIEGLADDPPT